MTDTEPDRDGRKRVVTTDGEPLGWATRDDDVLYVVAEPGLLRSCDSWVAPSWHERAQFEVDTEAVVGVGQATVVVDVGRDDRSSTREVDSATDTTTKKDSGPPR